MVRSENTFARGVASFAINAVLVSAVVAGLFYAVAPALA
jgi:hypothetical protein